jgi:GH18 family chitinase
MKIIKRLILILSFSLSTLISQRVVGYYPYWMQNEFPVNDIDMTVVTHVIHAFGWPDQNGNVLSYSNIFNSNISEIIHDEGRMFLLSLGGWGNDVGFPIVSASALLFNPKKFI